jgi:hypothetical protein
MIDILGVSNMRHTIIIQKDIKDNRCIYVIINCMTALSPQYTPPISKDFEDFKTMVTKNSAEMQGGFLVSNRYHNDCGTYWVNPRAVGKELAEVIEIKGIKYTNKLKSLLNFLDKLITDVRSRVILLSPDKGFSNADTKQLNPEGLKSLSIHKRAEITEQAKAIEFTESRYFPACFDTKLIQIARWKILQAQTAET